MIAFAFIACKNWTDLGWELEDNPVATAFEVFWMFFEPMLFAITGSQIVVSSYLSSAVPDIYFSNPGLLPSLAKKLYYYHNTHRLHCPHKQGFPIHGHINWGDCLPKTRSHLVINQICFR